MENAVENVNKEKLLKNCTKTTSNGTDVKTKTRHVHQQISGPSYKRQPTNVILQGTKLKARTLILARHGMLECGTNYKGTMSETCRTCGVIDNENHRLNDCSVYNDTNLASHLQCIDFHDIYAEEDDILNPVLTHIENVWEFKYANGRMKRS